MQQVISHSPEETQDLAKKVISYLKNIEGVRGTGTIVALQGDLGAGKTVFAKGVARALGVEEVVTSPTFVISKIYNLPDGCCWKRFVHVDAYRLSNEEELSTIDWDRVVTDPYTIVLIEWPEQVGLGVPERALWISFETIDNTSRTITLSEKVFTT